jgi:hypothetical protein
LQQKADDFSIINLHYHKKRRKISLTELVFFGASKDYVSGQNEENNP